MSSSPTAVRDYMPFISRRSARRQPSALRALIPIMRAPGMISLGTGFPNPQLFPFSKAEFTLTDGSVLVLSEGALAEALQYGSSYGLPSLLEWLRKHMTEEHRPPVPASEWDILVTNGSQDGLAKTFDMLLNEGDVLITETPTYSGALSAANATGAKIEGLASDAEGLLPSALEARMLKEGPKPRVVYIIPTGQNPAGSTMGNRRREEIYALCQKYNLMLIEDDPYWNLRFTNEPLRSFFSMDVDGRVIRMDSFSKVISSGFRLGWVTGPKFLVERVQLDQQSGVIHPSSLSQAAVAAVLQKWGDEGWKAQIKRVREFYTARRDYFVGLATKHLDGLATWNVPSAGMFLWFQLIGVEDSAKLIQEKAVAKKVVLVPGKVFLPDGGRSNHVRASFSVASHEDMDTAMQRLRSLLLEEKEARTAGGKQ